MRYIADLHIHSPYSRATSKSSDLAGLNTWAQIKGIHLVGTGDFTHPGWMAEITEQLQPAEEGLFQLKPELQKAADQGLPAACTGIAVRFVLQVDRKSVV